MVDWGRIGAGIATMGASEMARDKPFGSSDWSVDRGANEFRDVDPNGYLLGQTGLSNNAANEADRRFFDDRYLDDALRGAAGVRGYYQGLMNGQDSQSRLQLSQGLGQAMAQQRAMAAGARPGNQAMASRTAMLNQARIGSGMAGQAALQGMQERQLAAQGLLGANQAYGNMALQQRGQNLDAMNAQRQQTMGGLNMIEQQRGNRFHSLTQTPTKGEMAFQGTGQAIEKWKDIGAAAAQAMSDIRSKQNISPGGGQAEKFMDALRPYSYDYKPGAQARDDGRRQAMYDVEIGQARVRPQLDVAIGPARTQPRLGIMAQDLERSPIGQQAVINGPQGKMVDQGQLALGLAAGLANLNERLRAMEGRRQ